MLTVILKTSSLKTKHLNDLKTLEGLKRSFWPILWFRWCTRLLRKLSEIFISYFQTFQMVDKNQHLACMLSKSHESANVLSLLSKPKNLKISKSGSVFRVLKPTNHFVYFYTEGSCEGTLMTVFNVNPILLSWKRVLCEWFESPYISVMFAFMNCWREHQS